MNQESLHMYDGILVRVRVKLLYDWRFTANKFVLAASPLRLAPDFFSIEHLRS
jgi:hypothetical protein